MRSAWDTFKRFLTAEEVPRWFGLSIVLIYLVGLGAVADFGIEQARREGLWYAQQSMRRTVEPLVTHLSGLAEEDPTGSQLVHAYQRALREFALDTPAQWLRIVDTHRRIVASIDPREIGSRAEPLDIDIGSLPAEWRSSTVDILAVDVRGQDTPGLFLRAPIAGGGRSLIAGLPPGAQSPSNRESPIEDRRSADPTASRISMIPSRTSDAGEGALFLEGRLALEPFEGLRLANQAKMLAILLVALGALFVVYRCLREQLRGMSRIANRLQTHGDRLEEDLASLRIADTLDGVTTSWNELIDLTQGLLKTARRSEANEELSLALQRSGGGALAEALNSLPDGIVYIVDEVRFEYLNAAAQRLFGWDTQEVKQITLTESKAEGVGGKVLDLVRDALQAGGSFEERTDVLEAAGDDSQDHDSYRVRVVPLQGARRQGECVVLIRDVSQQIRAERARDEFMTQVTHELRTPLTNIRAYTETLSSGMFEDPSVIAECYNVITKETRRLSRLVEDVLSVSQLEIGTIDLQIGSVDLKTLLTEGIRDLRGLADEKNIDIQLVLPDKLEPIQADRDKLAVVINNLLGNAIKYTPSDGKVLVGVQHTGGEVALSVKDNGIGIDPADHARVFEKFQRTADPEVQNQSGTGIGLYTARQIVRRHRGDIELISEKGQGAMFLVRLPRADTRATSLVAKQEPEGHAQDLDRR